MRDLLPLLASGGTGPSSADVGAHLAECQACREELELLRATRQALAEAPAIDVRRIARAIPAYRVATQRSPDVVPIASRRRATRVWQIAATALIVVAGGTAIVARQAADPAGQGTIADVRAGDVPAGASEPTGGRLAVDPVVAVAGQPAPTAGAVEGGPGMTFGGGLDDLSEDELVAILAALENDEVLVPAEPDTGFPVMSLEEEES